uniref:ATP synthase F0 subunit 8 n=1 Tax=Vertebrata lanosa TaxID=1261582 RepID=A0A1J0F7J5_9FLOR|nr:ATP synthase F0 subunit 8 [Vertebrata lanosa]APC24959.1 ATP synthase F0 subunit 8 [Vertebrata lanosa]
MPQLDILIILPQIFWFIIFFSIFYFILTYYFLPIFLKTINSRKYFLENNKILENKLVNEVFNKRKLVSKELNLNFIKIKSILFFRLIHPRFNFRKKPFSFEFFKLNNKVMFAVNKSILYCNLFTLNTFKFYPKVLNKIKKI